MSQLVSVLLMAIFFGSVESRAAEEIRISVSGGYNMIFLSSGVAQHADSLEMKDSTPTSRHGRRAVHRGVERQHRLHLVDRHGNPRGDPRIAGAFGRRPDDGGIPEDGLKLLIEQAE
jgi:hypothetical protein